MYANKNNLRSELTANVSSSVTSISITSGEGVLRDNNMVACLEHYEGEICTKREIIKITAKNNDTFTITRGFAVCIMNDNTKAQGNTAQDFSTGDFLSLYLSKELWESITTGITTNETNTATMIANITAPKTCINNCCQDWKDAIDCAYISKYCGVAGFGTGADGDCVITADEFLCASCEYNFNNLTICDGVTVRFCGSGTPTINVWNNFKNCGVIDMRAPYLQAGSSSQTDCWLEAGCEICNQCESLTGIADLGGLYCGNGGGCQATTGCGGDGGSNPGSADGYNGGNGITSGCFGTGGGGAYGTGTGGDGGSGSCSGGDGGNGFYGGNGGEKTGSADGGGGNGGVGVVKGGNAGGGRGSCDYTTMGNGGNAITNVYGLHLNARNIWNNLVDASGGDGGNGGEYKRYGTSGGFAPTGGCGGNGANGGQMLISYQNMCEQGCFDVSKGKGGIGGKIGFSCETCWRYEQPDGADGNDGWVVFKSSRSPYISNFTLTDDSGNQAVLINWRDPGITSWNKTMVRYSITDYPATITDGTLAVEETTKNQYFSTPYSLTGLSNGTTYYFTAFALDSDNNIIDTETATITTQRGWQPTNPYCWYKFNGDMTDSTLSFGNATGTSSFETLSSGIQVLQTNGINLVTLPIEVTSTAITTYTITFRMKVITTSPTAGYYMGCGDGNANEMAFFESTAGRNYYERGNSNNGRWNTRDITPSGLGSGWRLVTLRSNGPLRSDVSLTINATNTVSTGGSSSSDSSLIFGWGYNLAIGGRNTVDLGPISVQISNLIISHSCWTDQELQDMYDQTKADYGL